MMDKSAGIPAEWTLETLRVYVLSTISLHDEKYGTRFDGIEKATNAALMNADRAVQKAETAAEKRFESVNEFRNTLSDQQRNLMPRSEVDVMNRAMTEKIVALEKQVDNLMAERAGIKGGWGYAVGIVGFLLALVTLGVLAVKAIQP